MTGEKISDLLYANKMAVKVDNSAVQDGYNLYHHAIFFNERGNWTIIQQGMNSDIKMARRYHWISDNTQSSFITEPHSGIICDKIHDDVLNMTACDSIETQKTTVDLIKGNTQNLIPSIKKLQLRRYKTMDDWILDDHNFRVLLIIQLAMKCQDILTGRLSRKSMIFNQEIMKSSSLTTALDHLS